jgi:hypothetical protein
MHILHILAKWLTSLLVKLAFLFGSYEGKRSLRELNFKVPFHLPIFSQPACPPTLNPPPHFRAPFYLLLWLLPNTTWSK